MREAIRWFGFSSLLRIFGKAGLALALFMFGLAAANAAATHRDTIFGFELSIPDGWRTVFAPDREEVNKKFGGEIGYIEKNTQRKILPYLLVIEKGEPAEGVVRPSVKIAAHPSFNRRVRDPVTILRTISSQAAKIFPKFELIEDVETARLGGTQGARARYTYELKGKDGKIVPVLCEIWLVPHGRYFVQVAATMNKTEAPQLLDETLAVIQSFHRAE